MDEADKLWWSPGLVHENQCKVGISVFFSVKYFENCWTPRTRTSQCILCADTNYARINREDYNRMQVQGETFAKSMIRIIKRISMADCSRPSLPMRTGRDVNRLYAEIPGWSPQQEWRKKISSTFRGITMELEKDVPSDQMMNPMDQFPGSPAVRCFHLYSRIQHLPQWGCGCENICCNFQMDHRELGSSHLWPAEDEVRWFLLPH